MIKIRNFDFENGSTAFHLERLFAGYKINCLAL
jgi:hypothetical protein